MYILNDKILATIRYKLEDARKEHPMFQSFHHGYAVILEELDEMWDAIKQDNMADAIGEAYQIAAMAIRFVEDLQEIAYD